jgi:tol-pal system protein YbgF
MARGRTMKDRWYLGAGAVLSLLVTGCATETKEFKTLRDQVRLQQKQITDLKTAQEAQQSKLEILDNGFRFLGDKVDENSRTIDDFESAGKMPTISSPVVVSPVKETPIETPPRVSLPPRPARPAEPIVVQPKLSAADLYRAALGSFTREDYPRAILEFEEFVANYPGHDLADNAQYWIGECYYAQKNFELAVVEFDKVGKHFSAGNKAPAALLKKGLALKEAGRDQEALAALGQVVSSYPASEEATIAEQKLSQWR